MLRKIRFVFANEVYIVSYGLFSCDCESCDCKESMYMRMQVKLIGN